ncbi:MAG: hypothetical protein K2J70_04460, partial [Muribaculaceae bacterium]|nr:hypothetical protein [Muribaculaceae bacterium]
PTLSPEDFRLLILLFSGLSSLACATILDIKPNTFYSRKKRIEKALTIINPPDKDLFLRHLNK